MSEQTSEALRNWFKRVEPYYPELFNSAYVICGNYEQAENAVRSAILEVWAENIDNSMGFREKLRSALRNEACRLCRDEGASREFTWPGLRAGESVLVKQALKERVEVQRMLMLRYGVGLSCGRIAALMGFTRAQVRDAISRFESRGRRVLPSRDRARFASIFSRVLKRQLDSNEGVPRLSNVYRAFAAEASGMQMTEHRVSRAIYRVLVIATVLICAGLFWLFAVLMQSPSLEVDPLAQPTGVHSETTQMTEAIP